ncbi:GNAT family N-acetyltransferase [Cytobacillus solani]|uniref:N-acetyltransferase domain-containing protein n=1 Tax=Cytobacillus solani TaxID=1637975 RepID=A0A0Q3QJJ4_9BACI|nr:GNAT family N-acetyltransferase [Cytobacillus solani]KOP71078.1 hypothetical protein AMS60_23790 [Bacillus sp. FJAT-21945]KQL17977.1 hypothetical protein AN957_04700 [Cytobacillus solani]USK55802.1 GNAT family N-acetyltransferase [Cytobacillus solani]
METKTSCLERYQDIFLRNNIKIIMLSKDLDDIERMKNALIGVDSKYLFPTENKELLFQYIKKIIDNGYNFILTDGAQDIGMMSLYANDFVTKTAYTTTIGLIPSHRGGSLIGNLVKFSFEFAKEKGMEKYRAEVHKSNEKWLNFLLRFKFEIESETENDTYMIVRDL